MIEKRKGTFSKFKQVGELTPNGMIYKKVIHVEPVEQDYMKCDFPGCTKESPMFSVIDSPYWSGYQGKTFCKLHFENGKFLIDQGAGKIWVIHNIENSDKSVGEIIEIVHDGYYRVQWYFDGQKLSTPGIYHASVLTILGFVI